MTQHKYDKQPGDLEIRIRPDGSLILVAPDQELLDLAQALSTTDKRTPHDNTDALQHRTETVDPQHA